MATQSHLPSSEDARYRTHPLGHPRRCDAGQHAPPSENHRVHLVPTVSLRISSNFAKAWLLVESRASADRFRGHRQMIALELEKAATPLRRFNQRFAACWNLGAVHLTENHDMLIAPATAHRRSSAAMARPSFQAILIHHAPPRRGTSRTGRCGDLCARSASHR